MRGLSPERAWLPAIDVHLRLLEKWSEKMNLTSVKELLDVGPGAGGHGGRSTLGHGPSRLSGPRRRSLRARLRATLRGLCAASQLRLTGPVHADGTANPKPGGTNADATRSQSLTVTPASTRWWRQRVLTIPWSSSMMCAASSRDNWK